VSRAADTDTYNDGAPFRAPRRRAVQAFAWGVPIVLGGLLATYLATEEQRARSVNGPSLQSSNHAATDTASAPHDVRTAPDVSSKPQEPNNSLDSLPTGNAGSAILGGVSTEELAQGPGAAPQRAASVSDAAGANAERGSTPRSPSVASSPKKPVDSKAKLRPITRPASLPLKPAEPSAAPQQPSDPDVGF
jgi:hypothetical protein